MTLSWIKEIGRTRWRVVALVIGLGALYAVIARWFLSHIEPPATIFTILPGWGPDYPDNVPFPVAVYVAVFEGALLGAGYLIFYIGRGTYKGIQRLATFNRRSLKI